MVGDQASVSFQLSQGLVEKGDEVWQLLPDREVYHTRLPDGLDGAQVCWVKGALGRITTKVIDLARTKRFDIIHTHGLKSFGVSGSIASMLEDTCHVVHLHGSDIRLARDGRVSEIRNRLGASHARMFLYSTPDLAEWYFFRSPAAYLPNPINLDFFKRMPDRLKIRNSMAQGKRHVILCPARFDLSRKSQDILAKAVSDEAFEDVQTVFLSAVGGMEMDALQRLCGQLRIMERVSFLVGVPYQQMPLYYGAADVVALAFRFGVFGCAVLESMACETPVVSHFDYSRYGDQIRDRPPIVNAQTVSEVSARLDELLGDPGLRRRLGTKSRRWVAANHSLGSVTGTLRSWYARILEKPRL